MFDDEYEEYEAMSVAALGTQGCCKVFCEEYRKICPDAKIMACRRENGSISHVFIERNGRYFDARGKRDIGDMLDDVDIEAVEISEAEFIGYYTIASESRVMKSVCRRKFVEALNAEKEKYGL